MNKISRNSYLQIQYKTLNKAQTDILRHKLVMKTSKLLANESRITKPDSNIYSSASSGLQQRNIFIKKTSLQRTLSVYQWRYNTCFPVIKPIKIVVKSFTGSSQKLQQLIEKNSTLRKLEILNLDESLYEIVISIEKINTRLTDVSGPLPLPQLFYLLKQIIVGFECLVDIFGLFEPSEEMVIVNGQNEWRFWISEDFASNCKKQSEISENEFILKILKMVQTRLPSSKSARKFFQDLGSLPKNKLNFLTLLNNINIYTSFNKIAVSKKYVPSSFSNTYTKSIISLLDPNGYQPQFGISSNQLIHNRATSPVNHHSPQPVLKTTPYQQNHSIIQSSQIPNIINTHKQKFQNSEIKNSENYLFMLQKSSSNNKTQFIPHVGLKKGLQSQRCWKKELNSSLNSFNRKQSINSNGQPQRLYGSNQIKRATNRSFQNQNTFSQKQVEGAKSHLKISQLQKPSEFFTQNIEKKTSILFSQTEDVNEAQEQSLMPPPSLKSQKVDEIDGNAQPQSCECIMQTPPKKKWKVSSGRGTLQPYQRITKPTTIFSNFSSSKMLQMRNNSSQQHQHNHQAVNLNPSSPQNFSTDSGTSNNKAFLLMSPPALQKGINRKYSEDKIERNSYSPYKKYAMFQFTQKKRQKDKNQQESSKKTSQQQQISKISKLRCQTSTAQFMGRTSKNEKNWWQNQHMHRQQVHSQSPNKTPKMNSSGQNQTLSPQKRNTNKHISPQKHFSGLIPFFSAKKHQQDYDSIKEAADVRGKNHSQTFEKKSRTNIKCLDEFSNQNKKMTESEILNAEEKSEDGVQEPLKKKLRKQSTSFSPKKKPSKLNYDKMKMKDTEKHFFGIMSPTFGVKYLNPNSIQSPNPYNNSEFIKSSKKPKNEKPFDSNNINNIIQNEKFQKDMNIKNNKSKSNSVTDKSDERMRQLEISGKNRINVIKRRQTAFATMMNKEESPEEFLWAEQCESPQFGISKNNLNCQTAQTMKNQGSQQSSSPTRHNGSGSGSGSNTALQNINSPKRRGPIGQSNLSDLSCKTHQPINKALKSDTNGRGKDNNISKNMTTSQNFNNNMQCPDSPSSLGLMNSNNWSINIKGLFNDNDKTSIKVLKESSHIGQDIAEFFQKEYLKDVKLEKLEQFGRKMDSSVELYDSGNLQGEKQSLLSPRRNIEGNHIKSKCFSMIEEAEEINCQNENSRLQYSTSMIWQSKMQYCDDDPMNSKLFERKKLQKVQIKACDSFEEGQSQQYMEESAGFQFERELYRQQQQEKSNQKIIQTDIQKNQKK